MSKILLTTIIAFATTGACSKESTPEQPSSVSYQAKISMDTARKTALERVAGTVLSEELEEEGGRWIYTFDIKLEGVVKEVHVDPEFGTVLRVEDEDEDDEESDEDDEESDEDDDKESDEDDDK